MLPPPFAMRQCVTNLTPTLPCIHVASLVSLLLIVSHMFEGMSLRKSFASRKSSSTLSLSSSKYRFSLFENFLQKPRSLQEEEGEEDGDDKVFPDQFSEDRWSKMLPEIIGDIIKRIESREEQWPVRRDVVACACVCRRWREVTRAIVRSTQQSRMITFPSSLKQPGPGDRPMQCLIKRDKKNSTFYLYLGQTPTSVKNGKFLLAAQRFRHGAHTEYIISLDANDVSQRNYSYMGKVSSNFLGKKFTIYDSQPPHNGAKPSSSRPNYHFANKQIFPQGPLGSFEIGQVSYNFNVLRARGPRRMFCTLHYPSTAATNDKHQNCKTDDPSAPARWVFMKNKAPRWHEHLQCWCLNFHGRVTVASVKNFQLVVAADPMLPRARGDDDVVLLQFGKVGNNVFTMDYRDPLSAFQAFAVCLTSFGMNLTYK